MIGTSPLQSEEVIAVPVVSGDLLGDGRKRLVELTVVLKILLENLYL